MRRFIAARLISGVWLFILVLASPISGGTLPPDPFGSPSVVPQAEGPPDPFAGIPEATEAKASYRGAEPEERDYAEKRIPHAESLVPFRSSWEYATILNFRPGDGVEAAVNPPRFSWPYLREVVAEDTASIPPAVFSLQIAEDPEFEDPLVDVCDTPYNFYNALRALEGGRWYWRVGYGSRPEVEWSEVRSFTVADATPRWDRSVIERAVALLAAKARPRTGPEGGWAALREAVENDPATAQTYGQLVRFAGETLERDWWTDFPRSDRLGRPPQSREEQTRFIEMLKACTNVAYLYRLTGDGKYRPALDHIVEMASWPQGGLLSPEGGLGGHTKMPSQAAELFAVVYDWFADELPAAKAAVIKEAVRWRLHDMYFHPDSIIWRQGDASMRHYGLAYVAGSHPYQNFSWTVPAILLMAGEMEEADRLVPLALNYLAGVTAPDGPDEGYNEGHGYSNEKAGTLLSAALVVDMLLPELEIGRNPAVRKLIDWFVMMFPGAERLPWGDSWLSTANGVGGENLRRLTYLTASPVAKHFWLERAGGKAADNPYALYARPWFEFGSYLHYREEVETIDAAKAEPPATRFLPEAGWVFAQSQPIRNFADYFKTVGMQFQMRPRGGYGHSYASDGSFVWYGYGALLSCGGGWRSWASLGYSRSPMSHNTLLIGGRGHDQTDHYAPQRPYTARPLAFEEGESHVYWAADLTEGYRHAVDGVMRVHRHVLFLDGKWFLIVDDLAMKPEAEPQAFSWLFHVYQNVPVEILKTDPCGFDYAVGRTQARVRFANRPETLAIENREGRDGYLNPLTGEDHYPGDMERVGTRSIFKAYVNAPLMKNNLWVSSREASHEQVFFSVLAAGNGEHPLPEIRVLGESRVEIVEADGTRKVVSIDPAQPADIVIDLERVREHARSAVGQ